ncbi:hypothetical protein SP90_12325 [Halodesulfovibrio spirochaetisodalis]|uniref:Porin n=2 Tax=Halodesulfovibrio spirochaetisodalis TaxID=1560234 RepID=A0A1B7XB00_9BACT|nr:hypothetical protein SP90_12325 [Halodesulfovibrio spirochaetisodalis]
MKAGRNAGGDLGSDGVGVETKRLFIHYKSPNLPLSTRVGIQGLTFPGFIAGSVIFDDDVAGVVTTSHFTKVYHTTFAWIRPFDVDTADGETVTQKNKMDMFLAAPFITTDLVTFTPFISYAALGQNVKFGGDNYTYDIGPSLGLDNSFLGVERTAASEVYWLGLSAKTTIGENLNIYFDGIYGQLNANEAADRSGGFTAAKVSYTMDKLTPSIVAWWASGDDADAYKDGAGRMPFVNAEWTLTTFGFDDTYANESSQLIADPTGKVAVGIFLEDVKFWDFMTQELRVLGMWGTNDSSIVKNGHLEDERDSYAKYLTDKDFALEINYEMHIDLYEQLELIPSLAYIHLDLDDDVWTESNTKDAWRVLLITQYSF